MLKRTITAIALFVFAGANTGCITDALTGGNPTVGQGAAIVGTVTATSATGKALAWSSKSECPEVIVELNGSPADVVFDDDCSFLVRNVAPSELVTLRVEIPSLGISGLVELQSVADAELIEIAVRVGDDSLAVVVERRAKPLPGGDLPNVINGNNVSIKLPAGVFAQDLTVNGNNFALKGEAAETCAEEGWTVIEGKIVVNGNNARFFNVKFVGSVEVRGNNTKFINCCFDGVLVSFGKGHGNPGGHDGKHGDDDGDDDDDDDD